VGENVGVVVLARLSSKRLPGKALMMIDNKEAIGHVLDRICSVVDKSKIVIATSTEPSDDLLESYAKSYNFRVFRGSLENVSSRFYEAAKTLDVDYACRINGDNVFLATDILIKLIDLAKTKKYLFLSNVLNRTFPKGVSIEIVELNYYHKFLPAISASVYHSEHVMTYMYDAANSSCSYFLYSNSAKDPSPVDLALDTIEDYNRCCWMAERLDGLNFHLSATLNIYNLYEKHISG